MNEFRSTFSNFSSQDDRVRIEANKLTIKLLQEEADRFVNYVKNYTSKKVYSSRWNKDGYTIDSWKTEDFYELYDELLTTEIVIDNLFSNKLKPENIDLFNLYGLRLEDIIKKIDKNETKLESTRLETPFFNYASTIIDAKNELVL